MRLNSLKDRLSQWEILQTTLRPQLGEIPQLTEDLALLERILLDGKSLEALRGSLLESLAASSRTRKELMVEGDAVFRRMNLALRAKFGPKSERLLKYGVTPERPRRRRSGGGGGEAPTPEVQARG